MARWIGSLNEGSLLRRTLLHVGTFVLGSLTFVGVISLVLVSIAKAVLPPHGDGAAGGSAEEAGGEATTGTSKTALGKTSRSKRPRLPAQAGRESAPSAD
ncbi:hypothetical protein WMF31_42070 [Sorangium sp. So ce1036]|uniref:hypothetical protein n=1 Tax=Sorangium sp. So ce1036 TaxID=3133328 RepID=UPI003F09B41E